MSDEPASGWATKQELRAFSDAVAPQIVELLDTSGLALPRRVHGYAKTAARSFSFTREVKLSEVVRVVAFLAIYGEYERLFALARTVAPVPHTGNETVYEPARLIVHTGYYFAGQQANDAVTAELAPYRFVPADFWRPPGYLAGEHLRRQFELAPDEAAKYASHPLWYHAGISAGDLPVPRVVHAGIVAHRPSCVVILVSRRDSQQREGAISHHVDGQRSRSTRRLRQLLRWSGDPCTGKMCRDE